MKVAESLCHLQSRSTLARPSQASGVVLRGREPIPNYATLRISEANDVCRSAMEKAEGLVLVCYEPGQNQDFGRSPRKRSLIPAMTSDVLEWLVKTDCLIHVIVHRSGMDRNFYIERPS